MDCAKVGKLILQLRKEKGLTQKQIADQLNISNKTVSKWECGLGCPDVTLWEELSAILGADILKLLQGELEPNRPDVGKIDRIQFYVCPTCGNILTSTGKTTISCCGRRLHPLTPIAPMVGHELYVEEVDTDYYITLNHEMRKDHYIFFAAYVYDDLMLLNRLYPEQSPAFRLPIMRGGGILYLYCTKHGLQKYPSFLK
ncbi:helix-turn-helix domain-containing protein [Anaerocolumna sedimenticola]|uniref:Helix-turn-helix domain-containing protein n=1 Tax=Anaerocolumna sedimenticola TaxID=2696063 RepID=A0A6P1TGP0_9FIRM|nr:helix-turn-helix domain-containing protein [Anaerocolumna sedimenticola]QHQ59457.1 helix-turn-helix domain-containing protein [Anaerocolumna sedimenticola]